MWKYHVVKETVEAFDGISFTKGLLLENFEWMTNLGQQSWELVSTEVVCGTLYFFFKKRTL